MLGHELAVEQLEAAGLQPGDQPCQRYLGGIGAVREHAFAEESRAELHPIETADQFAVRPALDRMGMAEPVQLEIALLDLVIDPGLLAGGTLQHNLSECLVPGDGEGAGANSLAQGA